MKKIIAFVFSFLTVMCAYCDNKTIYENLLANKKMDELSVHLTKWQKEDPKNPEMFIGFFNYYLQLAISSGVSIDATVGDGESFMEITDPKTGRVVGYINDKTFYDLEKTEKGLSYLYEGLKIAPDRLDMVFGKTHVLIEIKEFTRAVESLTSALDRSLQNNNKWLWSDNQPIDDGENFLIGNLQDYYQGWINEKTPESLQAVAALSLVQIEKYPNHVYAYDNYAYVKSMNKEYSAALEYLKKAEGLDPNDLIVINNIANCYRNMGEKEKSIQYYSKIVKSDNKDYSSYAQKQIDSMNK